MAVVEGTGTASAAWYFEPENNWYAAELKQWLEEEMKLEIAALSSQVEVLSDSVEVAPDPETSWKNFKPGDFITFIFTCTDGQRIYKTFRKTVN